MPSNPTVREVAENFTKYIDRVVHHGEKFVLVQGERPVAELRPVAERRLVRDLPDLLASLPRLAPEDLEAFESDLDQARAELGRLPIRDPWES
ncbi:MAG: type II toxin-antitoxin system Phd/YefM family antitoxin [Thermoanaerobaculia bacterium]